MQLSYRHASVCKNSSFTFLKKIVRDQGWPSAPLFVVNISPSFGEFTTPLRHILVIHNVTIKSNNLFVYLDVHSKPVLPLSKEHGSQVKVKVDGSVATISIKNFLLAYT
jgi:hypothetical protein